jgi:hypothetical protein
MELLSGSAQDNNSTFVSSRHPPQGSIGNWKSAWATFTHFGAAQLALFFLIQ